MKYIDITIHDYDIILINQYNYKTTIIIPKCNINHVIIWIIFKLFNSKF